MRYLISTLIALFSITLGIPTYAQIPNGGFESGNSMGWVSQGSGSLQVLPFGSFGSVQPSEGAFFALLGNGPGDIEGDDLPDSISMTSQSFDITTTATSLIIDWDFVTAEFTGIDSDQEHLDYFSIILIPNTGSPIILESGNVSMNSFSLLNNGNSVSAPDGTSVFEQLGFQKINFSIQPGTYNLQFNIFDAGDGSFDSGLVIDNIHLSSSLANAPEPTTMVIFCFGIIALFVMYFQRFIH